MTARNEEERKGGKRKGEWERTGDKISGDQRHEDMKKKNPKSRRV